MTDKKPYRPDWDEYFMDIANGEYKPKTFKQDIIETWQWNNCYDN